MIGPSIGVHFGRVDTNNPFVGIFFVLLGSLVFKSANFFASSAIPPALITFPFTFASVESGLRRIESDDTTQEGVELFKNRLGVDFVLISIDVNLRTERMQISFNFVMEWNDLGEWIW